MKKYLSTYLGDDPATNTKTFNHVLETVKDKTRLIFPNGTFIFSDTILQSNKTLYWEGAEETTLMVSHKGTGLKIGPSNGATYINNITLFNREWSDSLTQHGLEIQGIVIADNLTIRNFFGNGLHISADIGTSKTNSSFSRFTSLSVSGCKGSGVYLQGGDANQCNFYHVDVRDNQGYGIHDSSFLGNQFFGCMAHLNWKGNYRADDLNSRTGFYGCYSEMGSPPEYLGGHSVWFGGLPSNGIELHQYAKKYTQE